MGLFGLSIECVWVTITILLLELVPKREISVIFKAVAKKQQVENLRGKMLNTSKTSRAKKLVFTVLSLLMLSSSLSIRIVNPANADSISNESESKVELQDSAEATALAADIYKIPNLEIVGIRLDEKLHRLEVWSSSESKIDLAEVQGKAKSLLIQVHRTSHKKADLDSAISHLNEMVEGENVPGNMVISSTEIKFDGSGILITLDVSSPSATNKWIREIESKLGVPVFVDPEKTDIQLASSRVDDGTPWRGGSLFSSYMSSSSVGYCSQGFGVRSQTTNLQYMMTARHCFGDGPNQNLLTAASSNFMGSWSSSIYYNSPDNDISLTFPDGGVVRDSVYYGSKDSTTAIQVQEVSTTVLDTKVCTDGGNSGMHCNVKILSKPGFVYTDGHTYSNVVKGANDNGNIVVAMGDSGGPVISDPSAGPNVTGFGIIHALEDLGNCANFSIPVNLAGSHCGKVVYWIDLSSALSAMHMNLK